MSVSEIYLQTADQEAKGNNLSTANDSLTECTENDKNFIKSSVTGYETQVESHDLETDV